MLLASVNGPWSSCQFGVITSEFPADLEFGNYLEMCWGLNVTLNTGELKRLNFSAAPEIPIMLFRILINGLMLKQED